MDDLDDMLRAHARPVAVPPALMARILADAAQVQPRAAFAPQPSAPVQNSSLVAIWQVLADIFGGGGAVAGLATAACAGIYLGVAQPSAVGDLALALVGTSAVDQLDFMPSIDTLLAEE